MAFDDDGPFCLVMDLVHRQEQLMKCLRMKSVGMGRMRNSRPHWIWPASYSFEAWRSESDLEFLETPQWMNYK